MASALSSPISAQVAPWVEIISPEDVPRPREFVQRRLEPAEDAVDVEHAQAVFGRDLLRVAQLLEDLRRCARTRSVWRWSCQRQVPPTPS